MNYERMFAAACEALGEIDALLGIGADGCGSPDQTIAAVKRLIESTKPREGVEAVAWMEPNGSITKNKKIGEMRMRKHPGMGYCRLVREVDAVRFNAGGKPQSEAASD